MQPGGQLRVCAEGHKAELRGDKDGEGCPFGTARDAFFAEGSDERQRNGRSRGAQAQRVERRQWAGRQEPAACQLIDWAGEQGEDDEGQVELARSRCYFHSCGTAPAGWCEV